MILAGGNSSKMKSWRIALRRLWLDESQDKPVENFDAGNTTVEKWRRYICNPKRVFYGAVILALIFSLLSIFFTYDIYRDTANVYAYYAREIGNGNWHGGWVQRIPMLLTFLAGCLAYCGVEAYTATIVVSSLFYVATAWPLRALLSRYLTPLQAAWGVMLFVLAPKLIRFSTAGLLESIRYFFLVAAFLYFFRVAEQRRVKDIILLGVSLAGLTVARGEGLPVAVMALVGLPFFALLRYKKLRSFSGIRKTLLASVTVVAIYIVGISPFCYVNYVQSNYWVPDVRVAEILGMVQPPPDNNPEEVLPAGERLGKVLNHSLRGAYEPYFAMALLGMVLLLARRRWNWEYTLLISMYFLHLLIYFQVVSSYRYYIFLIPLLMPFTITGLDFCRRLIGELFGVRGLNIAAGAVMFFMLLQIANGMEAVTARKDKKLRLVAELIRQYDVEKLPERRARVLFVRYSEVMYWSGAEPLNGYQSSGVLYDFKTASGVDFIILDKEHLNLLDGRQDLERVYADVAPEVYVFKPVCSEQRNGL